MKLLRDEVIAAFIKTDDIAGLLAMRQASLDDIDHLRTVDGGQGGILALQESILRIQRGIGQVVAHLRETGVVRKVGSTRGYTGISVATLIPGAELRKECNILAGFDEDAFEKFVAQGYAEGNLSVHKTLLRSGHRRFHDNRVSEPELVMTYPAQRALMVKATATLDGISSGLEHLGAIHPDVTAEEAQAWISSLARHRLLVERVIKQLRKRI